jgi:hypothetical protein
LTVGGDTSSTKALARRSMEHAGPLSKAITTTPLAPWLPLAGVERQRREPSPKVAPPVEYQLTVFSHAIAAATAPVCWLRHELQLELSWQEFEQETVLAPGQRPAAAAAETPPAQQLSPGSPKDGLDEHPKLVR